VSELCIGVDVGGSSIKAAAVDARSGAIAGQRVTRPLPQPSRPSAVVAAIANVVTELSRSEGATGPVGVDVPAVVQHGVTLTAANIDAGWIGFDLRSALAGSLDRPVAVVNDADAAGVAEIERGTAQGRLDTVLVVTLGTGFGSAMFHGGRLVPNFELGHMEIRGAVAESRSCAAARVRDGLSWAAWAADLDEHLRAIHRLLWPDLIVIGGGVSERFDEFRDLLTVGSEVRAATFLNDAGLIGAALLASRPSVPEAWRDSDAPWSTTRVLRQARSS
jgi:polyphosphate glucokinase